MTTTTKKMGAAFLTVMLLVFIVSKISFSPPKSTVGGVSKAVRGIDVQQLLNSAEIAHKTAATIQQHGCPSDDFIKDLEKGVCGYMGLISTGKISPIYMVDINKALMKIQQALKRIKQHCGYQHPPICEMGLN